MLTQVTDKDAAVFDLSGAANVTAKTTIGNVPISGIPFSVTSNLKGTSSLPKILWIHN